MENTKQNDITTEVASPFLFYIKGGERGRRPPLPEIVRSSYRRLQ